MTNTNNAEFGNLTMYLKALVWNNEQLGISSGLGITAPTADDFTINDARNGNRLVDVQNESVHLLPFVGFLYAPDDRLFVQGFAQLDIDSNGNSVSASSLDANSQATGILTGLGTGRDSTYAFFDLSAGYWIYKTDDPDAWITGMAPIIEVHHNQSLDRGSRVAGAVGGAGGTFYDFGSPGGASVTNGVIGLTSKIRDEATVTLGYATPLGGDRQFDGELRVTFNWLFGNSRINRGGTY